jgi:hypothetical protein
LAEQSVENQLLYNLSEKNEELAASTKLLIYTKNMAEQSVEKQLLYNLV